MPVIFLSLSLSLLIRLKCNSVSHIWKKVNYFLSAYGKGLLFTTSPTYLLRSFLWTLHQAEIRNCMLLLRELGLSRNLVCTSSSENYNLNYSKFICALWTKRMRMMVILDRFMSNMDCQPNTRCSKSDTNHCVLYRTITPIAWLWTLWSCNTLT